MVLIEALIGGGVEGIVSKTVEHFLNAKKKKTLIAPPLAMGYFTNFLVALCEKVKEPSGFSFKNAEGISKTFKIEMVKIEIIIPGALSQAAIIECKRAYEDRKLLSDIFTYKNQNYRFKYEINGDQITIIDYAKPIEAIFWYYESFANDTYGVTRDSDKWKNRGIEEMAAFAKTIEELKNHSVGKDVRGMLRFVPKP